MTGWGFSYVERSKGVVGVLALSGVAGGRGMGEGGGGAACIDVGCNVHRGHRRAFAMSITFPCTGYWKSVCCRRKKRPSTEQSSPLRSISTSDYGSATGSSLIEPLDSRMQVRGEVWRAWRPCVDDCVSLGT